METQAAEEVKPQVVIEVEKEMLPDHVWKLVMPRVLTDPMKMADGMRFVLVDRGPSLECKQTFALVELPE